ncbi:MAG: ribonuclease H-like YkuK family protein [Candidatus Curtissbacteria bacterium]|nr:ribonuclease H-like YkuK family protein [Candidatus Curtissbacteria bacterium]
MANKADTVPQVFTSPTYGQVDWEEALAKMAWFMGVDTTASYEIIIGTDSEAQNGTADYVSALIVHKKGKGGIYFWSRQKVEKIFSMKQRIWQEALMSLGIAEKLVGDFAGMGLVDLNLEIHVDVGPNGPTRELIADIVGMIKANGFRVATKPSSWGASHVADRHV